MSGKKTWQSLQMKPVLGKIIHTLPQDLSLVREAVPAICLLISKSQKALHQQTQLYK